MAAKKILLIDTLHEVFTKELTTAGYQVIDATDWALEKILEYLPNCTGVAIRSRFTIDKKFIDTATQLVFICRAGAGMENIDIAYAQSKNIVCINSPEGNRDAVAEHALGMLLMLQHRLMIAHIEMQHGLWQRAQNRGIEIKNKTIALIGFGNMGRAFAQRLQGFEANILAYDPYISIKNEFPFVTQVELDTVFEKADIVSLHVPETIETTYMVNDAFIQRFAKNIVIINTARGKNVHTADLIKHIKTGKVMGACLDVLEFETTSFEKLSIKNNPQLEYLLQSKQVILTPHIAGWTHESHYKLAHVLVQKVLQIKIDL